MSKKAYTAAQFDHVEGLEAIQLRPGMLYQMLETLPSKSSSGKSWTTQSTRP